MDENITNQAEAEIEIDDSETSAFDEGWEDSDTPATADEEETVIVEETDAQPDDEDDDDNDADSEPDAEAEETAETEDTTEDKPETTEEAGSQRFKLRFLGEDKEVSLDEMRDLAEKGLNYAHVKEERDSLREKTANLDKFESYEGFLGELAKRSGMSVDELIESTRARVLMQDAEKEGRELSEEEAINQVREATKKSEQKAEEPAPEMTEEQKKQDAVMRFISLYPDVKSTDIPQSVWDEAERVGELIGPYQKFVNQKLSDEIAQLKQNKKNRERSTGSRRSAGATTPKDAFDEGWDS